MNESINEIAEILQLRENISMEEAFDRVESWVQDELREMIKTETPVESMIEMFHAEFTLSEHYLFPIITHLWDLTGASYE